MVSAIAVDPLEVWQDVLDAVREAVDNDKPRARLVESLEALNWSDWRDLADDLERNGESLTVLAELLREYVEVGDRVATAAEGRFPQFVVDALGSQFEALFDDDGRDVWVRQVDALEENAGRYEEWTRAVGAYADAIEAAELALEDWTGAEDRDEKADARDELMHALENLVTAHEDVESALVDFVPEGDV